VKKVDPAPALVLSETDKREMCVAHGWVGRKAFQLDRHDLCKAPAEALVSDEEDDPDHDGDGEGDDVGDEDEAKEADEEPIRWSRAAARERGIPPKKTVAVRRITQVELAAGRVELQVLGADEPYDRPKTRDACQQCPSCQLVRDGKSNRLTCGHQAAEVIYHSRPCVFIACKHALYLDISETGSIILNFPHLEPGQMRADQSCSLDLADRGGMTLEEIAVVTNLTRERIRQIELKALIRRARPAAIALGLGAEDAAAAGEHRRVGPGQDLVEAGVDGELPSDVATILGGGGGNRR
jgi:Sigma-70, region 4